MSDSDFPALVITVLKARSRGICEFCGVNRATQAHHRQYKSRGGAGVLSNALHLCGSGNHSGCHGVAHSGARGEVTGLAIRSGHAPETVPYFRLFDGTWWLLDDAGESKQITATEAMARMREIGAIKEGLAA